jgi:hypothetical protein
MSHEEAYLSEMFAWYEEHEPQTITKKPRFEDMLSIYQLNLWDLSFTEIINGDLESILKARGIAPLNNQDYHNQGGVA